MRRLVDIEDNIKTLIAGDINNPEIFKEIYNLAYLFFRRNRIICDTRDAEEVAAIVAEELYMKIYRGGEIFSWIGYINRSYQAYIRIWRKLNSGEIIDTADNYELKQAIVTMSLSSTSNIDYSYNTVLDSVGFENVSRTIDNILKYSKYPAGTREYINCKITVLLSLCRNEFVSYDQSEDESMYTRILYSVVKDEISKDIKIQNIEPDIGMTLLQHYNLSTLDGE